MNSSIYYSHSDLLSDPQNTCKCVCACAKLSQEMNKQNKGTNKQEIHQLQEYILEVRTRSTVRWGHFLQHKNILAMFLEPDCIGFNIPQNVVKIFLIHT